MVKRSRKEEKQFFEVKLLCRNCEHDWIEEIDKGIYVRYEKDNIFMIKKDEPSKKKNFVCPNCGANKKIARLPMRDFRG
jgi:Zn finger protein HypA/HybF involved in hydrogenase expression